MIPTIIFSGKKYIRGTYTFKTKAEATKYAKELRSSYNHYAVIDKRKDGWFIWQRMKPEKPKSEHISYKEKFKYILERHITDDFYIKKKDIPIQNIERNKRFLSKFIKRKYLTLYKGVSINTSNYKDAITENMESVWTTSKQVAYNFTESPYDNGKVVKALIDKNDVLISYHTIKDLNDEKEVIVDSNPKIFNFEVIEHRKFKDRHNLKKRWS